MAEETFKLWKIPKFFFLRRVSKQDLSGSHEVEFVKLPIRLVVFSQTGLSLVTAVVGGAGCGGLAGKWSPGFSKFESSQDSKPAISGAKHHVVEQINSNAKAPIEVSKQICHRALLCSPLTCGLGQALQVKAGLGPTHR